MLSEVEGAMVKADRHRHGQSGRWLQAAFLAALTLIVGVATAGVVIGYQRPELIGAPQFLDLLADLGIPAWAATTVGLVVPALATVVLAVLIFIGRKDEPMALFFALALVGTYAFFTGGSYALTVEFPGATPVARLADVIGIAAIAVVLFVFPDGRFVPPWSRWAALSIVGLIAVVPDLPATIRIVMVGAESPPQWKLGLLLAVSIALFVLAAVSQVLRYRRVSSFEQRQQTRLFLFSFGLLLAAAVTMLVALTVSESPPGWVAWVLVVSAFLGIAVPVLAGVALFRYRLYDVDLVINRTLVYGSVVGLLAVFYSLVVVVVPMLIPAIEQQDLLVAAATLAAFFLFNPLRGRVQRFVDRRFYRTRYDAQAVADRFAVRLRGQVDLETLTAEYLAVVDETVKPESAEVWIRS